MTRRDPLLEAVAQRLREDDDLADPRWDALAAGTLSAEEEAELEGLAARGEAARQAYQAFRPITDEERGAIEEGAFAEIARRKAATPKAPEHGDAAPAQDQPVAAHGDAAPAQDQPVAAGVKSAAVIPIAGRRRAQYAVVAAVGLAAAAAFALLYRPPPAPIASYVAFVEEGRSPERPYVKPGDVPSSAPLQLQGGARVHVTLRPETAVPGQLLVRSFLAGGAEVRPWEVPAELGPNGTLRVAGLSRATFSAAVDGAYDLVFVIARPDALPSEAALRERLAGLPRGANGEGFQIVALPLRLGPP